MLDAKGISYEKRIALDEEYQQELVKKLLEETQEFAEAGETEELADVLEVIEALRTLPRYAHVEVVQKAKASEKGGFVERIILKGDDGK